jgi:death-on-curing protein
MLPFIGRLKTVNAEVSITSINYICLELSNVERLHKEVLLRTQQNPQPLRDSNSLISALNKPKMEAKYLEADLIRQAAVLCVGISQAQAFVDGNKRTAVAVTETFLRMNGFRIPNPQSKDLPRLLNEVAERINDREQAIKEFEAWLRQVIAPN